jgi:hypothetical protein
MRWAPPHSFSMTCGCSTVMQRARSGGAFPHRRHARNPQGFSWCASSLASECWTEHTVARVVNLRPPAAALQPYWPPPISPAASSWSVKGERLMLKPVRPHNTQLSLWHHKTLPSLIRISAIIGWDMWDTIKLAQQRHTQSPALFGQCVARAVVRPHTVPDVFRSSL